MNDNVVDDTVVHDSDATNTVTNEKHDKSKSKVIDILIKHVPFPQKLAQAKLEKKYEKFMNLLKNVSIENPFLDAMSEIHAFMIGNLPPKLVDHGSFSIPVTVGNISVDRALCDRGASVSLMPNSMYKRLHNVNELTPTRMTL